VITTVKHPRPKGTEREISKEIKRMIKKTYGFAGEPQSSGVRRVAGTWNSIAICAKKKKDDAA